MKTTILSFLVLIVSNYLLAQSSFCGHTVEKIYTQAELASYAHFVKAHQYSSAPENTTKVPVKLWIIDDNAGAASGWLIQKIYDDLEVMNALYYRPLGIEFTLCSQENIQDEAVHHFESPQEASILSQNYYTEGFLNWYITGSIAINGLGDVIGLANFLNDDFNYNICAYEFLTPELLAHEFGHNLHLYHTHGKFNLSTTACVINSIGLPEPVYCRGAVIYDDNPDLDLNKNYIPDCLETGDDVCDTRAEPLLNEANIDASCNYFGSEFDPNGATYQPEVANVMSYTPDGCDEFLTEGQGARALWALSTFGNTLIESCPPLTPVTDVETTNIRIFPNPTKETLFINNASNLSIKEVKVYDSFGQLISHIEAISAEELRIGLKNASQGVYNLVIETDQGFLTKRFFKF